MKDHVYYRDRRGIQITSRYFRTRHKDQALAPITTIRIGREPLWLALAAGLGLALFAWRFGDLLYREEQLAFAAIGTLLLLLGWSIASLALGSFRAETTMLWGTTWSIRRIRNAIVEARHDAGDRAVFLEMAEDDEP